MIYSEPTHEDCRAYVESSSPRGRGNGNYSCTARLETKCVLDMSVHGEPFAGISVHGELEEVHALPAQAQIDASGAKAAETS